MGTLATVGPANYFLSRYFSVHWPKVAAPPCGASQRRGGSKPPITEALRRKVMPQLLVGRVPPSVIASRFSDAATLGRGMSFYRRILFFFGQGSPRLLSEAGDDVVGNPTRN